MPAKYYNLIVKPRISAGFFFIYPCHFVCKNYLLINYYHTATYDRQKGRYYESQTVNTISSFTVPINGVNTKVYSRGNNVNSPIGMQMKIEVSQSYDD